MPEAKHQYWNEQATTVWDDPQRRPLQEYFSDMDYKRATRVRLQRRLQEPGG